MKNSKINILYKTWHMTRFSWPRAVFLSSLKYNYIAAYEAHSMRMPIIALIDTNIKSHLFNFPLACNDDSIESISFMCFLLSKFILFYKFNKVIL
jgi:ribosomal protein S2